MNILLINPNTHNKYTKPPLGLLSVASVCKQAGHKVVILDATLLDMSYADITKKAKEYDLVGITAMTPYVIEAMKISAEIGSSVPVIIGGVHASLFPGQLYMTGLFSAVVVGEGEGVILRLLDDIGKGNLRPIYKSDDMVDIPAPDYSLIDVDAYCPRYPHADRLPWTSVQTSRGCPFNCTFCCNIFGKKYRAMPPAKVYGLLKKISGEYGVKDISFYDDEFTINRKRVMELCKLLVDWSLDLTWSCESRVDIVDIELLETMHRAGCRLIYYGIESGNQRILDELGKRITLGQAGEAVALTHRAGIKAAGYFMLGCPGETKLEMQHTIDFAVNDLKLDHAQFSVCTPLPGSKLYEQYGNGYSWQSFQYLSESERVYCPTEVSHKEIEQLVMETNDIWQR